MKTRVLQTTGTGSFFETTYDVPELKDDEIRVRSKLTGVCRSDIDMMQGNFGPLPLSMQGHEGLGEVVAVGANIIDVKVGNYVATRGEPAYADYYNVRHREYVKVPEALPKYIIEPVACGINIIEHYITKFNEKSKVLILGSGFLSWVAYKTLQHSFPNINVTIVGKSNKDVWGDKLVDSIPDTKFNIVVDLSSRSDVLELPIYENEATLIFGAQKPVNTDFSNLLWKACEIVFPSPRVKHFYEYMHRAARWIESGELNVDKFWSKGYNRDTEWQQAFADGVNRPEAYSRGYIYW